MLRETIWRVRQLLHRFLRDAIPVHDDRCVRLRFELYEPRERLLADFPVRVHHVRATGAAASVSGHTRNCTNVGPMPGVHQRQPVLGQSIVRRAAIDAVVRHVALCVPVEAQLPRGRVLHHCHLPDARHLDMLVHGLRHVAQEMVRYVRHDRSDQHRDRGRGHRVHTAHVHDDVRHRSRTDH